MPISHVLSQEGPSASGRSEREESAATETSPRFSLRGAKRLCVSDSLLLRCMSQVLAYSVG
jgi:hypothetical protein